MNGERLIVNYARDSIYNSYFIIAYVFHIRYPKRPYPGC